MKKGFTFALLIVAKNEMPPLPFLELSEA